MTTTLLSTGGMDYNNNSGILPSEDTGSGQEWILDAYRALEPRVSGKTALKLWYYYYYLFSIIIITKMNGFMHASIMLRIIIRIRCLEIVFLASLRIIIIVARIRNCSSLFFYFYLFCLFVLELSSRIHIPKCPSGRPTLLRLPSHHSIAIHIRA